MILYHVCRQWDRQDLRPLRIQEPWSEDLSDRLRDRWPDCDPWTYYQQEGPYVHCHATLEEALDYREDCCPGGQILIIDTDNEWFDAKVQQGLEYPHPVVRGTIDRECVRLISE